MATTLLRTLTEKSTLGFGKFHDMRIGNLLKLKAGKIYLIWVYFNCSNITFIPEILEAIKIQEKDVIKKPGKSVQAHDQFVADLKAGFNVIYQNMADAEKEHYHKTRRVAKKTRNILKRSGKVTGMIHEQVRQKALAQRYNHGKSISR